MCGLVSKWADDKELVDQAQKQDGGSKAHQSSNSDRLESKWDSSITVGKSQPLASKWAVAEESTQEQGKETRNDQKYKNSHRKDRKLKSSPKKPSHGNPHSRSERNRKPREAHEAREEIPNERRNDRKTKPVNFERNHRYIAQHDNDDVNYEEELPPITDAAKSLAARLGISSHAKHSVIANEKHIDDGSETTDDEESDHNKSEDCDEVLSPMTEAGMSLAQRLGMVTVQDKSKSNNQSRAKPSEKTRKQVSAKPAAHSTRGSYQTPRQKKMESVKKAQHQEDVRRKEEERIKEARLKSEVESMFAKLGDNTLSWADIEDDE